MSATNFFKNNHQNLLGANETYHGMGPMVAFTVCLMSAGLRHMFHPFSYIHTMQQLLTVCLFKGVLWPYVQRLRKHGAGYSPWRAERDSRRCGRPSSAASRTLVRSWQSAPPEERHGTMGSVVWERFKVKGHWPQHRDLWPIVVSVEGRWGLAAMECSVQIPADLCRSVHNMVIAASESLSCLPASRESGTLQQSHQYSAGICTGREK